MHVICFCFVFSSLFIDVVWFSDEKFRCFFLFTLTACKTKTKHLPFQEYPPPQNNRNSNKTSIKNTAARVNKEDNESKSNDTSSNNTLNSPNNRNSTIT